MNLFELNSLDSKAAEGKAAFHLAKAAQFGNSDLELPLLQRMVILEVVYDPTAMDSSRIARLEHDVGVVNIQHARALPRNSIVARRVLDGTSSAVEPAMFLFPFLPPHIALPCKPGEHVWAMFESAQKRQDVGYWLWRISEPHFVDDVNHTHSPRSYDPSFNPGIGDKFEGKDDAKYEFRNGRPEDTDDGGRYTVAESALIPGSETEYEKILKGPATALVAYGSVPRFRKRPADLALEGSNNALIVLGTDRAGPVGADVLPATDTPGAGVIDIVVGRGQTKRTGGNPVTNTLGRSEIAKSAKDVVPEEGDPDLVADRARVYIAQATKVDAGLKLEDLSSKFDGISDASSGDGAVAVVADKVRIVARSDVEIIATGFKPDDAGLPKRLDDASRYASVILKSNGDIVLRPGAKGLIKFGTDDADQHVVLGDELLKYLDQQFAIFNTHLHPGEFATPPLPAPPVPMPVSPMPPGGQMTPTTPALLSDIVRVKKSL